MARHAKSWMQSTGCFPGRFFEFQSSWGLWVQVRQPFGNESDFGESSVVWWRLSKAGTRGQHSVQLVMLSYELNQVLRAKRRVFGATEGH